MPDMTPSPKTAILRSGGAGWIALALAVLAAIIVWSQLDLRHRVQAQIAASDGEILDAVAAMQHLDDQTSGETLASLSDPAEQLNLALKISRLRNVLGVRLYAADGQFANAFPAYIAEGTLSAADLAPLRQLQPVSHFDPQADLAQYDLLAAARAETNRATVPLLVVEVPLRSEDQRQLAGVAQFLMDGSSIAGQFAALDEKLLAQSALEFFAGAVILAVGLGIAFRRVQRANAGLAARTADLLRANRELALSARVNAVGAVSAHLIHGLKNPLAGLKNFVRSHGADGHGGGTDWQLALNTTQRMQDLIDRVVRVLREQQTGAEYEMTGAEMAAMLAQKMAPAAQAAGVRWDISGATERTFSNREADLVLFILENLAQNAIDATPRGGRVRLTLAGRGDAVMEMADEGPGLSAEQAARLFTPGVSTKKGGSGIGLAISKQLAEHLGARLELAATAPSGSVFRLSLPPLTGKPAAEEVPFCASHPSPAA